MKLGLTLGSLRLGVREAIKRASKVGLKSFDVDATRGDITPRLSHTGRRDLLHYARSCGMEISALGGDFGKDLAREEITERLLEKIKEVIDLAADLRTPVVTIRIGRVPPEKGGREWLRAQETLNELGSYAEAHERCLASYTGEVAPTEVKTFLSGLKTQGVKVCYDPSLLVPRGIDPVRTVYELGGYIAHAYARDVQRAEKGFLEAVPGDGVVPFKDCILALCETGYRGFYVIKREAGEGRIEDIIKAKEFLEKILL